MKTTILILSFGIFCQACGLMDKHKIKFLREVSGLNIFGNISEIEYQYVKNTDYNYPYDFYSRFKCDSDVYLVIRRQISFADRTDKNDANLYISSRMLANDKIYLYAYNQVPWWNVQNFVSPDKLYVNYFEDRGKKRIGDSTRFNGKISVCYNKPYCYLYINCFPPL